MKPISLRKSTLKVASRSISSTSQRRSTAVSSKKDFYRAKLVTALNIDDYDSSDRNADLVPVSSEPALLPTHNTPDRSLHDPDFASFDVGRLTLSPDGENAHIQVVTNKCVISPKTFESSTKIPDCLGSKADEQVEITDTPICPSIQLVQFTLDNTHFDAASSPETPPNKVENCNDPTFMPFERATARQPRTLLDFDKDVKREQSFHKVSLRGQKLLTSIETMNQAEKADKINEISGRHSRKAFFGRDHSLAHVRRYDRQDVHDESDGAWQADLTRDRHVGTRYRCEANSLRAVFNLPENVVPMNNGHTELAFRDGTLVSVRGICWQQLSELSMCRSMEGFRGLGKFTRWASSLAVS